MSDIRRGDIFYVQREPVCGSEQIAGRPAIVVSNESNNQHCGTVEVVYLTTRPKKELVTHVTIKSSGCLSTALCEQVSTVSVERLANYAGHCTDSEMAQLEVAMMISLGIKVVEPAKPEPAYAGGAELAKVQGERDTYKAMYEHLLSCIMDK